MNTPFEQWEGRCVPLMRPNIDTDTIVRIERCMQVPRDALGPWAFEGWRLRADGTPDPDCPLNDARYAGASIVLAGDNFGCGSSREMAVWALVGMGVRCIIAPGYGEIFHSNCFQNGLLPVRLPAQVVADLAQRAADGTLSLRVDLRAQRIDAPGLVTIPFEVEPLRRTMLLQGLDEIGLTLTRRSDIEAFERADAQRRPWLQHRAPTPGTPRP